MVIGILPSILAYIATTSALANGNLFSKLIFLVDVVAQRSEPFGSSPQGDSSSSLQVIPSRFGKCSVYVFAFWVWCLDSVGHSMVLDSINKTLYIFAGQREDKYLSDMYTYNIRTGIIIEIFSNFSAAGGPDPCFTQRAVIDPSLKELYMYVLTKFLIRFKLFLSIRYQLLWIDKKHDVKPTEYLTSLSIKLGL